MEELLAKIRQYNSQIDAAVIKKAYLFAQTAHTGQKRLSGEPYFTHPLAVAHILAEWKMDQSSIITGLLHDTVEEGAATLSDIEKEFGSEIRELVDSITVVGQVKLRGSDEEEFVEALRKMFVAMAKDLRVVVIKLADRMHNMQTLQFHQSQKQRSISKETIEIYSPLAERLGMGHIKGQLEDLAFPYLYPEDYKWLKTYAAPSYKEVEKHVTIAQRKLQKVLVAEGIKAAVKGRAKHLYSLYKKLLRAEIEKDLSKVHDLIALRILVDSIEDCYVSLGLVHKVFKPVPTIGVSDFIALPKPNGYRSIHTKVFGPGGRIIEIQIRTWKMHEEAEFGVAAHFYYSSQKSRGIQSERLEKGLVFAPVEKLSWVKQLANWQSEVSDSKEFISNLQVDALSSRIFVLTPKGDVKDLPVQATPVDFAFAVHTDLGRRISGAKVNGKMVSLDFKLKSGDVCEIVPAKEEKKPNSDWLKWVKTSHARKEIQRALRLVSS